MWIIKNIEKKPSKNDEECFLFHNLIKNAVSGLGQFLATEIPLKMMKNGFNLS